MADNEFDIKGGNNQILPNAKEANQYHTHIEELHVLNEPTVHYGSRQSRMGAYFERLHKEIEDKTTREIMDDLLFYITKLDGTKGLEEKLKDGGFSPSFINSAMRKKEQYFKKATKYSCYPSAQIINLLIFTDIMNYFEVYIEPMIKQEKPVEEVMQCIQEKVVKPIMDDLNANGAADEDLQYTSDHIYGMIYYLTGRCHINWTNYDNV